MQKLYKYVIIRKKIGWTFLVNCNRDYLLLRINTKQSEDSWFRQDCVMSLFPLWFHIQFHFSYICLMNVSLQFSKTSTVVINFYSSISFIVFSLYRLLVGTRPMNSLDLHILCFVGFLLILFYYSIYKVRFSLDRSLVL